jgi:hypothetical protein
MREAGETSSYYVRLKKSRSGDDGSMCFSKSWVRVTGGPILRPSEREGQIRELTAEEATPTDRRASKARRRRADHEYYDTVGIIEPVLRSHEQALEAALGARASKGG